MRAKMFELLQSAIHNERTSKLQLVDRHVLDAAMHATKQSNSSDLRLAGLRFLVECTEDDCIELRTAIASHCEFLNQVATDCRHSDAKYVADVAR